MEPLSFDPMSTVFSQANQRIVHCMNCEEVMEPKKPESVSYTRSGRGKQ